jgi:hypothetical protein
MWSQKDEEMFDKVQPVILKYLMEDGKSYEWSHMTSMILTEKVIDCYVKERVFTEKAA